MKIRRLPLFVALSLALAASASAQDASSYSLVFRQGTIYDGSGNAPFVGDVAITDGRITAVAAHIAGRGAREIDAQGMAVAPGFINMLAHPEESLLVDGRAQSDLRQGVTLEVIGEGSMGPLSALMKQQGEEHQGDIKYHIDWQTLDQYLQRLQRQGISVNVASYVGAAPALTVEVVGETRAARLLPEPAYDPKGLRLRS